MEPPLIIVPSSNTGIFATSGDDFPSHEELSPPQKASVFAFTAGRKESYVNEFLSAEVKNSLFRNYRHSIPLTVTPQDRSFFFQNSAKVEEAALDALLLEVRNHPKVRAFLNPKSHVITLESSKEGQLFFHIVRRPEQ